MDVVADSLAVRRACGVVSGEPAFYESFTGRKHLALVQSYHTNSGDRVADLVERLGLDLDRPIRAYSRGMKQKLAIIQALAHRPQVLILDEPTLGLDPLVQQEFYRILAEEKARGVTVFLSSHILSEVERVCDRVGIVRQGFLAAVLDVGELHRHRVRPMEVTLERDASPEDFRLEGVEVVRCEGRHVELRVSGNVAAVVRHLATLPLTDVVFPEASLEDTFTAFYTSQEGPE
jgi:ABC-2 type transport system ATP-binding protein